ncbi:MAG: DUF1194 domain-containing protein [Pseudorhizobium sp.]
MITASAIAAALGLGFQAHAGSIDEAQTFDVDVAIVFAVDSSSSIYPDTADLQRNGHVTALTSPEFIDAISSNPRGCIGVTYFEWASPAQIRSILPWTRICGRKDAETAARVIAEKGDTGFRRRGRGGTSISSAIDIGSLFLEQFPGTADRKVIDISGNGENNDGLPVRDSRRKAVAKGYTINAIVVPNDSDESPALSLARYFSDNVIGGFSAFVMVPKTASDYTAALSRKLAREIAHHGDPQLPERRSASAGAIPQPSRTAHSPAARIAAMTDGGGA